MLFLYYLSLDQVGKGTMLRSLPLILSMGSFKYSKVRMFNVLIGKFSCMEVTYHILPSKEGSCSLKRNAMKNQNEMSIGLLHGSFAMAGNVAHSTFRINAKDKN